MVFFLFNQTHSVLFTLYTNDCTRIHRENYIIKFSGDIAILGTETAVYQLRLRRWCFSHRRQTLGLWCIYHSGLLSGIHTDNTLSWKVHVGRLCSRADVFFLRRLTVYSIELKFISLFYQLVQESIMVLQPCMVT